MSLIDILSDCWIPVLDCILWWKFVYGKIDCLGEGFIIVFMTAVFRSCLLSDVSGNDRVFVIRESVKEYILSDNALNVYS
jgi:hypothetical protein